MASRLPARALGEQRLARMAARGEQRAFEALFERYHRELYRYCRAVLGEPEEANDALQNTMAAALRHLPEIERRSSLRGWLYRVAHNEAVSILRRRPEPHDPDDLAERTVPGADVAFEQRERLHQLVADLRALPDRQRGALVMRELSDLSYSQIAAATGTSEAGARQLVYEARESLRTLELGRNLECGAARRVISERDGRMLRGRRLRAHLRACDSCRDFETAIRRRSADLAVLFPPLVPAATSGLLASLLGGGRSWRRGRSRDWRDDGCRRRRRRARRRGSQGRLDRFGGRARDGGRRRIPEARHTVRRQRWRGGRESGRRGAAIPTHGRGGRGGRIVRGLARIGPAGRQPR